MDQISVDLFGQLSKIVDTAMGTYKMLEKHEKIGVEETAELRWKFHLIDRQPVANCVDNCTWQYWTHRADWANKAVDYFQSSRFYWILLDDQDLNLYCGVNEIESQETNVIKLKRKFGYQIDAYNNDPRFKSNFFSAQRYERNRAMNVAVQLLETLKKSFSTCTS